MPWDEDRWDAEQRLVNAADHARREYKDALAKSADAEAEVRSARRDMERAEQALEAFRDEAL